MTDERDPENIRTGATIRALRRAHGLRTGEMAAALGVSHSFLSNVEAGRKAAPMPMCCQIADMLRIPLAAITVARYAEIREAAARAAAEAGAEPAGAEPAEADAVTPAVVEPAA